MSARQILLLGSIALVVIGLYSVPIYAKMEIVFQNNVAILELGRLSVDSDKSKFSLAAHKIFVTYPPPQPMGYISTVKSLSIFIFNNNQSIGSMHVFAA